MTDVCLVGLFVGLFVCWQGNYVGAVEELNEQLACFESAAQHEVEERIKMVCNMSKLYKSFQGTHTLCQNNFFDNPTDLERDLYTMTGLDQCNVYIKGNLKTTYL